MRPNYWNDTVKLMSLLFKVIIKNCIGVTCLLAERGDSTHKTHIYELFIISKSNGRPRIWKVRYNMSYNISVNEDNLIILRGQTICMNSCVKTCLS